MVPQLPRRRGLVPALAVGVTLFVIAALGVAVGPPKRTALAPAPVVEQRTAAVVATPAPVVTPAPAVTLAPVATPAPVESQVTERATPPESTALERSDTPPPVSVFRARATVVRVRDRRVTTSYRSIQMTTLEAALAPPTIVIVEPAPLPFEVALSTVPVQAP